MTEKTGGPAFPQSQTLTEREFISGLDVGEGGMTMRDYFAAKAMLGIMSIVDTHASLSNRSLLLENIAAASYGIADAMLKARES